MQTPRISMRHAVYLRRHGMLAIVLALLAQGWMPLLPAAAQLRNRKATADAPAEEKAKEETKENDRRREKEERREAERREAERREAEQREAAKRETERREAERRATEREQQRKRREEKPETPTPVTPTPPTPRPEPTATPRPKPTPFNYFRPTPTPLPSTVPVPEAIATPRPKPTPFNYFRPTPTPQPTQKVPAPPPIVTPVTPVSPRATATPIPVSSNSRPDAPAAPQVSTVTSSSVTLTAPPLPAGAQSLSLRRQYYTGLVSHSDAVARNIPGGGTATITGLQPNTEYRFFWVAEGPGGVKAGPVVTVKTFGGSTAPRPTPTPRVTPTPTATPRPPIPGQQPGVPGRPRFSNVTRYSVTVRAPSLPERATSMLLQRKRAGQNDGGYRVVANNVGGNESVNVTGLDDDTDYTFRFVAVGPGGQTAGEEATLETEQGAPDAPGRPSFYNVTRTSVTVRLPALPRGANSFILQMKASWRDEWAYRDIARGLDGYSTVPVTGLQPSTSYHFRAVAVGQGGSIIGRVGTATTDAGYSQPYPYPYPDNRYPPPGYPQPGYPPSGYPPYDYPQNYPVPNYPVPNYPVPPATGPGQYIPDYPNLPNTSPLPSTLPPGAPGQPVFGGFNGNNVTVTAPALPERATTLTLQGKVAGVTGAEWQDLIAGLPGGGNGRISDLQPGTSYLFRFVAVGLGGNTPGTEVRFDMPQAGGLPVPGVVPGTPDNIVTLPPDNTLPLPPVGPGGNNLPPLTPNLPMPSETVPAPQLVRVGAAGAIAVVPALPEGYQLAALQIKEWDQNDAAYRDATLDTLVQGENGYEVGLGGLQAGGNYHVRWIATGPAGRLCGASALLTTEAAINAPGVPEAPVVDEFVPQGATFTARLKAPALPPGARYMRLQVRHAEQVAAQFQDWGDFAGGAPVEVTGLSPANNYVMRWVAIGDPGVETPGNEVGVTAAENLVRSLPAPQIVALGHDEIWVQPREVPAGATGLTLQIKPRDVAQAIWVPASLLPVGENQPLRAGYLWPNTAYVLRWVADSGDAIIEGQPIALTTRAPQPAAQP